MNTVYIVDSIDDILMTVNFQECHFVEMVNRGWITTNKWLKEHPVPVMRHDRLIDFINETAI